jgi:hypothetical protein
MPELLTDEFNLAMQDLTNKFVNELKNALLQPYPYAPGFERQRTPFGRAPKKASGGLIESIQGNWDPQTRQITLVMNDYWRYVNDGRSPGKYVPLSALLKWIKQKGLKGRNKKTGRFIKNESFAWGINQNIKKFGIAPTYFYDKAFENFESNFEDEAIQALGIDIETFFESIFEENR